MPKNGRILAVVWLLLCALAQEAPGGSSPVVHAGVPYTIDVWETDDGLPQGSIIAMTQTRDGYLWLGTLNGLVRFDGLRFTVFDESNTPGLNSSRIVYLFEDSRGNLWIGTETAGVALMKEGKVTSLAIGQGGAEHRVISACEDAQGAVWLYTASGQLWRYAEGSSSVFLIEQGQPSRCRSVIAERGGPLWVGTDTNLYFAGSTPESGGKELALKEGPRVGRLDFLLASSRGGYWRLGDRHIQRWTTNRLDKDWGLYPWGGAPVFCATEDRQGNLLVGTLGAGVFWFDAEGRATALSTNQGLSANYILSLRVDHEGTLWVGTDNGGLNRVKRQVFDVLPDSHGWVVQSVCEDKQGGLWIGCNEAGANYWKGEALEKFGPARGLLNVYVKAMLVDRDERVWAGTWGGLFQLRDGFFRYAPGSEALPREISAIHQDRSGQVWVGTQGGLARWDGRQWRLFTTRDGLSADVVRAMADDAEGNLWIGTVGGGLNRLREDRFTVFRKQDSGLPSDDLSSLYLDAEGVLWIGTFGSGLARWQNGRWTCFTTREGLISNSVGYLIEDGEGYLWIGSNAGLMRVRKRSLNDYAAGLTTEISCRTYRQPDGLPTRECTLGWQPGACRGRDGKLWFPTTKGLASVNPAQLNRNTNPPPVIIESVLVDGRAQNTNLLRVGWPAAVTIPAGQERLEIQYTSLNLAAPDRARFKYRLENHETKWVEAGSIRVAHYSKLPPGGYRFQVIACNEDEVWNETGSSLAITVEPPFWRTWWFLTATAACLLGSIVAVVHTVSTQKLQRQLEMLRQHEALEKERARIARDIHDQLGASLTQVSLLGELVESDKNSPEEVEMHGRQISQTARDTTRALDEIVWTVNPSNDTLEGLANYVCKYAEDYFAVAGLRYRLDVPAQLPAAAISPEVRHNVFLAAKEAVTNVVRHAQATSVWVRLRLDGSAFVLEIEDNGRGPAGMEAKSGRNGLRNMRKRMEDVGGSFNISPAPEAGTLVRLTVPLGKH